MKTVYVVVYFSLTLMRVLDVKRFSNPLAAQMLAAIYPHAWVETRHE